ncbi:hypothetical protein KQH61_03365 [bacterium]|nr:hypothetical protein [bacterium]
MIRPTKHMDLKTSVINISSEIISMLLKTSAVKLEEVENIVVNKYGQDAKFNITKALSFLYLLGIIDYEIQADAIYTLEDHSYHEN